MLLTGKVAVITGGGQGIGEAIARRFIQEGAECALCDINAATLSSAQTSIQNGEQKITTYVVDVSNYTSVDEAANKIIDKYGRIDILINNAGITRDNLLLRMKPEEWDMVLRVNLTGIFNCTKSFIRQMVKQRSGKIVNIASVVGLIGNAGQCNYAASKAGVIGFTKSVAREVAQRGITVNAIAPGFIATAMTDRLSDDIKEKLLEQIPMHALGTPEDVANAALFLSSDLSSYITGDVLCVSGGMVMR